MPGLFLRPQVCAAPPAHHVPGLWRPTAKHHATRSYPRRRPGGRILHHRTPRRLNAQRCGCTQAHIGRAGLERGTGVLMPPPRTVGRGHPHQPDDHQRQRSHRDRRAFGPGRGTRVLLGAPAAQHPRPGLVVHRLTHSAAGRAHPFARGKPSFEKITHMELWNSCGFDRMR